MARDAKPKLTLKLPSLPPVGCDALGEIVFVDDADYGDFVLSRASLIGQAFSLLVIERARFENVRCNSFILNKPRLADLRLENCDLSNAQWCEGKLSRIEIVDSKMTGFRAVDSELSDCLFQNCSGELMQFHGSVFKKCLFKNCQFKTADFRFCNLEGCVFLDCDLHDVEYYDAKLSGTDFRGSYMAGLKVHPGDLQGVVLDGDQASFLGRYFANLLGVDVREDV
ncbi:MAG: pentapeptide repeat-containing protein [Cyanobacteria bacterium REEB67]|nr:pentapeptide repeat-containing protein [Cyanobacteria bacterium REEB67]